MQESCDAPLPGRRCACPIRLRLCAAALLFFASTPLHAADPLVDGAVTALAQLTDPRRLETLPDPAFRAQLGPALGWLHVARRRDVAPEAVIGRAFALNGLDSGRARLTREALLRNLARADAWELFGHETSARALADGRPAQILTGVHRGHLAETAIIVPEGLGPHDQREFACLVLRSDDEMPSTHPPASTPRKRSARQPGDMMAGRPPLRRVKPAAIPPADPLVAAMPEIYDDALPVAYTTLGSDSGGAINVRVEAHPGQPVDLGAYGGPPVRFLLRGADATDVRFSLLDGQTLSTDAPVRSAPADGTRTKEQPIYEQAGVMRISLCGPPAVSGDGARTFLFEFPARVQARPR